MSVRRHLGYWLGVLFVTLASAAPTALEHEPLRFQNSFRTPEEVISYYCGRDASGFVWSGLLEVERKAFTFWKDLPEQDSFYVAQKYEIASARLDSAVKDEASVEVTYELLGVADAHGTVVPAQERERRVVFRLKKERGAWKILSPEAASIAPVVLASKFQFANL
ncbi:MAG: hypothetical protein A2070_03175 [Bdellovibrionales bacterium GWC1_52_8]|nr:MAG: hypothetical protein A2Z97_12080 [Bdellovibrionales bacterium GWB1_52_6]OFZ06030.1 MAG: hypothetical protein A2X97_01695 [Bdellovibrionales bacterium GWA1_52_35]OFZ41035.1 MAG: hypothetical protein A2070_03175 [Bdellovibrionales bacterium GWC1_52_8]